jgi:hypothetical protein
MTSSTKTLRSLTYLCCECILNNDIAFPYIGYEEIDVIMRRLKLNHKWLVDKIEADRGTIDLRRKKKINIDYDHLSQSDILCVSDVYDIPIDSREIPKIFVELLEKTINIYDSINTFFRTKSWRKDENGHIYRYHNGIDNNPRLNISITDGYTFYHKNIWDIIFLESPDYDYTRLRVI